jgi:hypothetical protein
MKTTIQTTEDNNHMKALLDEVNKILKGSGDLNKEKEKLGNILDEIMYWEGKENSQYEEYYKQFSEMTEAMCNLDFTTRLSLGTPKSFVNFVAFALNMVNEELKEKVLPVNMFQCLLEAMDLKKDSILLITDAGGIIRFLHTGIDKPYFKKEALVGQSIAVLFKEDIDTIDQLIKKEGTAKSLDVNMAYGSIGSVKLRIALPTVLENFEGIAYVITIPKKV